MAIAQPAGTVTLVFTDIEGSTRLLDEVGVNRYREALAEHRRIVREALAHGYEVDYAGDAFFYSFSSAQAAVEAVRAAMGGLQAGPIKIRVGIHTGEPVLDPPKYVGIDVHKAARLMSAGNGGQALVSASTAALVDGFELRDLGEHRFKDLAAPERVFQLGPDPFPLLKSLYRTNLPVQPTQLIGRDVELAELGELLARSDVRLVTLTGPGGSGKTRLGLQAAAEAADRMADGVFWVSLAPIPSAELVLPALARALGVQEVPGEPIGATLRSFLAARRLLLLLDNFEHVLEARTELAGLLAGCPDVLLLVTSRAALKLSSEHLYEVPPLRKSEAVDLFVERAGQAGMKVAPDAAVAAICQRLDRLPLAIELAAARVRALEPQALLERLDRSLPLLKGGAADLPARQQTLHATIAWSHDLLDEEERAVFRRLSVFAGSFTLESVEAVAETDLWTLESLVTKSLVRRWGSGRLGLLETIREFAAEQLESFGDGDATRESHARHYLELALTLEPHLPAGALRVASIERLAAELDNLRAALLHYELTDQGENLLRLATAMFRFWQAHGYFGAGRRWLERALRITTEVPDEVRAPALEGLGVMCLLSGDFDEGERLTREGLDLFRSLGDERGTAESIMNLGLMELMRGDHERAIQFCEEAATLASTAGLRPLIAVTLENLAGIAQELEDFERAAELANQATELYEALGDEGSAAAVHLGPILVERGRYVEGMRKFVRSLESTNQLPQRTHAINALVGVGAAVVHERDPDRVARLVGAADALLDSIGSTWNVAVPIERRMRTRALTLARERLSTSAFDAAYAAGAKLTFEEAVSEALDLATPPSAAPALGSVGRHLPGAGDL